MFNKFTISLLLALATLSSAEPANVILIIGDGMDDQQITIARNYLKGASGKLLLDDMPLRSVVQVQTVHNDDPTKIVYVADSANSASTIATGILTSRGRISTAAKTDEKLTTIIEYAQAKGYKTGLVSSSSITDATPAAFIAHIHKRFCENPNIMLGGKAHGRSEVDCSDFLKSNGGLGSISEQLADSNVDVLLGGGLKHFEYPVEDKSMSVIERAKANGFEVVTSKRELLAVDNANTANKLLGLFAASTMPVKLRGEAGRIAEKPVRSFLNRLYKYIGDIELPSPMRCEPNPNFADTPELKSLTEIALQRLSNDRGFFLMVESASIDKQAHRRNPCGSIGELEQLDEVLAVALNYANSTPNTLVLVTADHGQAAQLIPQISMYYNPDFGTMPIATRGAVARLITIDGAIMGVNYATNDGYSEEHSGVNVPLFANRVGANLIVPFMTQADIFHSMMQHLGLSKRQ